MHASLVCHTTWAGKVFTISAKDNNIIQLYSLKATLHYVQMRSLNCYRLVYTVTNFPGLLIKVNTVRKSKNTRSKFQRLSLKTSTIVIIIHHQENANVTEY